MMDGILIYHSDPDGYCSAAVVVHRFPSIRWKFYSVTYGFFPLNQIYEDLRARPALVAMVDFSWIDDMREFIEVVFSSGAEFIWVDHHETTPVSLMFEYPEIIGAYSKRSAGAGLTWDLLFDGTERPRAVDLVDIYDRWVFHPKDDVECFVRAVSLMGWFRNPGSTEWQNLIRGSLDVSEFIELGRSILENDYFWNSKRARAGFEFDLGLVWPRLKGKRGILINSTDQVSQIGSRALDLGFDLAMLFSISKRKVAFHLRSRTLDCSELAKTFGGGGHKGAGGFHLSLLDGMDLLTDIYKGKGKDSSETSLGAFEIFRKTGRVM